MAMRGALKPRGRPRMIHDSLVQFLSTAEWLYRHDICNFDIPHLATVRIKSLAEAWW